MLRTASSASPAAATSVAFVIPGEPVQWARPGQGRKPGSKTKTIRYTKGPQRAHMEVVQRAWLVAGRPQLPTGPLEIDVTFYLPRPKSHVGTGRNAGTLRTSAPAFPTGVPDCSNLIKLVEDALNTLAWADDALFVDATARKRYAPVGSPGFTEVKASVKVI